MCLLLCDWYFADFRRNGTRPTHCGRVSPVENHLLYSGFRGRVARIVRCNIVLMVVRTSYRYYHIGIYRCISMHKKFCID